MMKLFNKLTEMPVTVTIALVATLITVTLLAINGQADIASISLLVILGLAIGLQAHYGSIVAKRIVSVFMVLYIASLYTYFITNIFGYITQPFLLTIAGVTSFLATTYDKNYMYEIRSRKLWGVILAILLVIVKMTIALSGFGFWIAELIGLNVVVIYIIAWRLWTRTSKKTKITPPKVTREESDEKYKYIYIDNRLNFKDSTWVGMEFRKNKNAYPYIYSETMKANDDGLVLAIISESKTDELYDQGEIEINKVKRVPYLYIEAKEKTYLEEIMRDYEEGLEVSSK